MDDRIIDGNATRVVEILEVASCWMIASVHPDDVEHERQQMEAKYRVKLAVHEVERVPRSGVVTTRITWKVVD